MVADSGKNATKMLEAPNELLERNGLERIAIFHRNAQADGSRAEGHLAVAERFRAHDAVTGDADLPEVLVTVARDVLGIVIIHVVWIFGYVTRFKLLEIWYGFLALVQALFPDNHVNTGTIFEHQVDLTHGFEQLELVLHVVSVQIFVLGKVLEVFTHLSDRIEEHHVVIFEINKEKLNLLLGWALGTVR